MINFNNYAKGTVDKNYKIYVFFNVNIFTSMGIIKAATRWHYSNII